MIEQLGEVASESETQFCWRLERPHARDFMPQMSKNRLSSKVLRVCLVSRAKNSCWFNDFNLFIFLWTLACWNMTTHVGIIMIYESGIYPRYIRKSVSLKTTVNASLYMSFVPPWWKLLRTGFDESKSEAPIDVSLFQTKDIFERCKDTRSQSVMLSDLIYGLNLTLS